MEARHYCMAWRGVKDLDSKMINSVMRGAFLKDAALRREFLALIPAEGLIMLVRLLYCSRAVDTGAEAIESILAQSRQHNPVSGITGILCYGGGIFLQCIEGGRMQVSDLFGSIQKDPRHKDVALLHYEEIFERRFGGWSMGRSTSPS
jgi:hypothetical protein